ncbi:hypothetical protein BAUCODRAFT_570949 [Baudoinia panamericana UAMH 10762]|uniref:YTH domain-containing protein n=1 Tax=Baudoinia panamericana (strain UAMH 10762) TaxID=717646 RepID=M2LBF0_BAUPA|nr:uncharacterized protein BAUCODRAFT_570949 [Baudoinia panamericana UAMH 10762]EMC91167.1 hypothetical protein BAUCODRAFT_570949 [Baudoinia panamericana UAMH 10762]
MTKQQGYPNHSSNPFGQPVFDMSALSEALPQSTPYGPNDPSILSAAAIYHLQQAARYSGQRGLPVDPAVFQTYQQPVSFQQHSPTNRPYGGALQSNVHAYGYGASPPRAVYSDERFTNAAFLTSCIAAGPARHQVSEPAPVPAYPRGPPRKPKQSGHALWVGNLPPAATVTDLKNHFSCDATKDIESLFLIAKSNCAFVNYRTEAACIAAMNRFHDSRFHGVRLVCRLRRGSTISGNSSTLPESSSPLPTGSPDGVALPDGHSTPIIVGQGRATEESQTGHMSSTPPMTDGETKVPEKYYILKSLTVSDLESSVRNGIWATQAHNEETLNRAFAHAENVYLIFSANKSGEYFGYARMSSPISGELVNLSASVELDDATPAGTPQSIPTPATDTAPKGRIIDDSARGTIFWEADLSDDDTTPLTIGNREGQQWGRQFRVEWISTSRLPFFRIRGLRNPWNANREVKIARDGTELEPSVGRRLLSIFPRPAPVPSGAPGYPSPFTAYR